MADFPDSTVSAGEPAGDVEDQIGLHPELLRQDRLNKLGMELYKRRKEWINARQASGVESRWRDDWNQYNGMDQGGGHSNATMMQSAQQGGFPQAGRKDTKPQRSKVFVNITRPKTNSAIARIQEMLFPSDDRNWGLSLQSIDDPSFPAKPIEGSAQGEAPTGILSGSIEGAQTAPQAQPLAQGQLTPPTAPTAQPAPQPAPQTGGMPPSDPPMTPEEIAEAVQREESGRKLKAMESEIDSQLDEAKYNSVGRDVLRYAGIMGTGVIKGPIVVNRMRKVWLPKGDLHILKMVEETKPSVECIDPRNIYPDPSCGNDIHNGSGIFEYQNYTPKRVRELAKQPNYIVDNIKKVLAEGPKSDFETDDKSADTKEEQHELIEDKKHFKVWSYWG